MKGNQGLEALAALCGGQSDAPTEEARAINNLNNQANESGTAASRATTNQGQHQQSQSQQESVLQQRQNPLSSQQSSLQSVTQQQQQFQQQVLAAAAALQGNGVNPLAAQSFLVPGLSAQQALGENPFSAMQQLAFHQYVQAQAKLSAQQAAQSLSTGNKAGVAFGDQSQQALMMALAAGKAQQLQHVSAGGSIDLSKPNQSQQQVIPSASTPAQAGTANHGTPAAAPSSSPALTSMKPPPPPSQGVHSLPSTLSTAGIHNQGLSHATIAPMPGGKILPNAEASQSTSTVAVDDKKQQKRAANRRSAQLSRKRKKQFIEELKEENDELRRKEQILRSIPDLIVVFDSSGKLGFVSQSVTRFIDMTPEELEGTSFWDRLCEDSVRLLKAAFMDSLAARQADSATAPLGSGVWELRLVDKDSSYSIVTLNGVVHFSGEAPECVCCIRPRGQQPIRKLPKERSKAVKPESRAVSSSDGSRSSDGSSRENPQMSVKPNQSVMSNETPAEDTVNTGAESRKKPRSEGDDATISTGRQVVRISDGDSGCEVSESGSDDGIASS